MLWYGRRREITIRFGGAGRGSSELARGTATPGGFVQLLARGSELRGRTGGAACYLPQALLPPLEQDARAPGLGPVFLFII